MSPPTSIYYSTTDVVIEGRTETSFLLNNEAISPQYFETLGIPVKEGRSFTPDDMFGRPQVVVINSAMARRYWPNENPVGKRVAFSHDPQHRWMEIIGVVGDVRFPSLNRPDTDLTFYRPLTQSPIRDASIELRTAVSPESLIPAVRAIAAEMDKDQPIFDLQTARTLISQNIEGFDIAGTMLMAFSVLGLVLAAVGIFGVVSYSVSQRTGEIGIRMALGAGNANVLWLVLRQGLTTIAAGVLIGLVGTAGSARLLSLAVPTLPAGGWITILATALGLMAVALLACYLPARWASKIDPIVALRRE
jgi:putative ABC transport system permease protein